MRFYVRLFIIMVLFGSCSQQEPIIVERGMYSWESASNAFSKNEIDILNKTKISKLYIKLFEVTYDSKMGAIPIAKTNFSETAQLEEMEIVPCVYIQNSVFTKMDKYELEDFVENSLFLITTMMKEKLKINIKPKEIQIDCDWTPSTKENYFLFLKSLKSKTSSKISCTLRLYPYKYKDKMGIPPVDRVMLMCYNLLSPKNNETKNSIFDLNEFEKYTDTKVKYPLPMDYAFTKIQLEYLL